MIINNLHSCFHVLIKTILLINIVLTVSCTKESEPFLRVGTNLWPGYETLYLAQNKSFYNTDKIRLVELPSATEVMHAFRSKNIEVAALTLDEAMSLADTGLDIKVFLVMDISHGADT
ncbi:MAG: hypothetical protein HQL46_12645, partial [Gammaproteobacteria bacterium]|nr:hypothetical protein [Gammaproteobacteria bacterium]